MSGTADLPITTDGPAPLGETAPATVSREARYDSVGRIMRIAECKLANGTTRCEPGTLVVLRADGQVGEPVEPKRDDTFATMIQPINVSKLGREELFELGSRKPYRRFLEFPISASGCY